MRMYRRFSALLTLCVFGAAACGSDVTSPDVATTTAVGFASRLQEGGSAWRTFTVAASGTVKVQLVTVSQPDVVMRIGIGTVSGTECTVTQKTETAASATSDTPQITATLNAGTYCVKISDIGNLTTIVDFVIVIVSPI